MGTSNKTLAISKKGENINMNILTTLCEWYVNTCNGKWEYSNGIKIGTLDNPGWTVDINLINTDYENKHFPRLIKYINDNNWISCKKENSVYESGGNTDKLEELIKIFVQWVTNSNYAEKYNFDILQWLQNWYLQNCDEDWEHCYGVHISTLDNLGWKLNIDIVDTDLEDKEFKEIAITRKASDWIKCKVYNNKFYGNGGPYNLEEILNIFRSWAESEI